MVTGIQKSSTFVPEIEQERSRISRTYKLFVTGPDTVSPFHLRSFSVRSPFYSRSTFVVHLFYIRFFSVPQRKTNGKKRKKTESKRIRSEEEANLQRTCGNGRTNKTFMSKDSFLNCRRVSSYFVLLQTDEVVMAGTKTNLFGIAQSGLPIGIRM